MCPEPQRHALVQHVPERAHRRDQRAGDHPHPVQGHQPVEPRRRQVDDGRLGQTHDQAEHAHQQDQRDPGRREEQADATLDRPRVLRERSGARVQRRGSLVRSALAISGVSP